MVVLPRASNVVSRAAFLAIFTGFLHAGDLRVEVQEREAAGDLSGARMLLERQTDASGLRQYAEFLDRHGDGASRQAYLKWIAAESVPAQKKIALRQLVLNDLLHGNQADLVTDLGAYRAAGGTDLNLNPAAAQRNAPSGAMATIPGPLPAFARMAALSVDLAPEDLLPALARNVVTNGYEASGNESLQQTEYLRLVVRYIGQARELQAMAGSNRKIVVPSCDSEETGALLKALGYRMRGSCGGDIVLETVNPTRAFLTVDSGFPLATLEAELRANHRFELPYAPTQVPVLYTTDYWLQALGRPAQTDFIDAFLADPSLCRLYLGLSHLDRATAEALRRQAPPARLKTYAHVLDFFGGMFQVKNGVAVTPGPARVWASMTGASPNNPGQFFERLISTDDGWMASYYDALSRIEGPAAAYLTQPDRLKKFYDALRGKITSPGPARPVFRSSTELMLLTHALRIGPDGQVRVPGTLDVWRALFLKHPHGKYDARLTRSANSWKNNDDLVEALFALSRKTVENEPLRIFLALNDIDRNRSKPISGQLTARLISQYRSYGAQYTLFADAPGLGETSINHYLDTVSDISGVRDSLLRADTGGTLQAVVELWRILVVRGQIDTAKQDESFAKIIAPFGHVRQHAEMFEAGRASVEALLSAAGDQSGPPQDQLVELLVGKHRSPSETVPFSPSEHFLRVLDAQRLISLNTLFAIGVAKGTPDAKVVKSLTAQLDRIAEADTMRNSLSTEERNAFIPGYWGSRHLEQERKFNLDKALKSTDRKDLRDQLAPFLRDSIVGVVYAYYAPPGAQLLLANPVFVRSHDFLGPENSPSLWRATDVSGTGWPASAGGRLNGSLCSLPYALAEAEQNFLTPRREQALIWADLVPQMIVATAIPRWTDVKAEQLRWVSLHLQRGRNLIAAAALDQSLLGPLMTSYSRYAMPARVEWLQDQLRSGNVTGVVPQIPPSVLYAIAEDPALRDLSPDLAGNEIAEMKAGNTTLYAPSVIGHLFGSPKPTLTHSYHPNLLHLRTFPALMGYSSRILAESWESNALYYAALADELGIPVTLLDSFVPDWNRSTIENIFATHLEDWPAILRSLHTTAGNVRQRSNLALSARNASQ